MLYELYTSLTTSCPAYVRDMDYLYEIIAMRGRSRRNRAAWEPHIESTRAFVLAAAERCGRRNRVVVYGAGLLLDVPLRDLSSMFQSVILIDIVFVPEVRRQARHYGNVQLMEHDAVNLAEALYNNVNKRIAALPEPSPLRIKELDQAGLVISLNLLSQVWVMPRAYVLKTVPAIDEEQLDEWCSRIVASHYHFLQSLSAQICLIADYEYVKRDQEGTIVNRGSTVYGLALPAADESWTWQIAPRGEINEHISKELTVGAWNLGG